MKKPFTNIDLLKKQLAEETKEKYTLYNRIKELRAQLDALQNKSSELSSNSGPDQIQRDKT
tara:strand:- start:232 stop:414 length:183 start_codon:yes stop_codon:yes gene_type:complete